ncbi:hypothetical protein PUN28_006990 [Cardiocondyla obscurior]|uniref:Uncharacterized protein n=1 Tax=Cardiocondyla obscurior TaxID=286306 RepID=A0AAW2G2S5_9HYME
MRALSAGGNYSDYANSGSVPLLYPGVPQPHRLPCCWVPEQFQTLFDPPFRPPNPLVLRAPPPFGFPSSSRPPALCAPIPRSRRPRTLSINLFIFRSKSVSLNRPRSRRKKLDTT